MKVDVFFNDFAPDIQMDIEIPETADPAAYVKRLLHLLIAKEFHRDMTWNIEAAPVRHSKEKRKPGRPTVTVASIPKKFIKNYPKYMSAQINISQLAAICELSRPTVYKYLRLLQEEKKEQE